MWMHSTSESTESTRLPRNTKGLSSKGAHTFKATQDQSQAQQIQPGEMVEIKWRAWCSFAIVQHYELNICCHCLLNMETIYPIFYNGNMNETNRCMQNWQPRSTNGDKSHRVSNASRVVRALNKKKA